MKRIKFRIPTWDDGRKFVQEIASELGADIEVRDARQIITTDRIVIHFHPDDRGFSYITCKLHDETLEPILVKYRTKYEKKDN